ncbi:MAG: hypothetical protein ACTS47_00205 [Candidatus Hodgkinia cicadicola]
MCQVNLNGNGPIKRLSIVSKTCLNELSDLLNKTFASCFNERTLTECSNGALGPRVIEAKANLNNSNYHFERSDLRLYFNDVSCTRNRIIRLTLMADW